MRGCLLTRGCLVREARGAPRAPRAERAHALVRVFYPTFARQAGGLRRGPVLCAVARPHAPTSLPAGMPTHDCLCLCERPGGAGGAWR
jgi:hypothetical protein